MSAVPDEVMKYVAAEKDDDPQETGEWLEALDGVISAVGPDRAHYLIEKQIEFARLHGEHQMGHGAALDQDHHQCRDRCHQQQ